MTQEERDKLVAVLAERYMSRGVYNGGNSRGIDYATFHYNMYSDEALLTITINHKDHNPYATTT